MFTKNCHLVKSDLINVVHKVLIFLVFLVMA